MSRTVRILFPRVGIRWKQIKDCSLVLRDFEETQNHGLTLTQRANNDVVNSASSSSYPVECSVPLTLYTHCHFSLLQIDRKLRLPTCHWWAGKLGNDTYVCQEFKSVTQTLPWNTPKAPTRIHGVITPPIITWIFTIKTNIPFMNDTYEMQSHPSCSW